MQKKTKKILAVIITALLLLQISGIVSAVDDQSAEPYAPPNTKGELSAEELATAVLSAADVPELLELSELDEKNHVKRLYEQEDNLDTVIFQNRDGTKSMYVFSEPVKYIDQDGRVKDKKTSISESRLKDGSAKFSVIDNDVKLYFPDSLAADDSVILRKNDYTISLKPKPPESNLLKINEAIPASKTSYADSISRKETEAIVYSSVFGEDTSVRYTPHLNGYKEEIILQKNIGLYEFDFILSVGELEAVCTDGIIHVYDPLTGNAVVKLDKIFVYDSYTEANELNGHATYNNEMTIKEIDKNGNYLVKISVDKDFLNSMNTIYPVYIDPSVYTISHFSTIQDATIFKNDPTRLGAGAMTKSYVGNYTRKYGLTSDGKNLGIARYLFRFPALWNSYEIRSLESEDMLECNINLYSCCNDDDYICVFFSYDPWTESTVKGSTIPWYDFIGYIVREFVDSYGWYEFDITYAAGRWCDGAYGGYYNYGVVFYSFYENNPCHTFHAKESAFTSYRPYVYVRYRK